MSSTAQLQPVLDHIDADFDNSLQRLFALTLLAITARVGVSGHRYRRETDSQRSCF